MKGPMTEVPASTTSMPKIANYIRDGIKAKTVAVLWVNNDFGKGGRDNFIKEMNARVMLQWPFADDDEFQMVRNTEMLWALAAWEEDT